MAQMISARDDATARERLSSLDERMRALQEIVAGDGVRLLDGQTKLADGQARLARLVTDQATAHAVLAQWMKDWTAEVASWKSAMERRMVETAGEQEAIRREAAQARGAIRIVAWGLATALTMVTGVLSGLMVRVLGEFVGRGGH